MDAAILNQIDEDVRSIYRLLVFSDDHQATDLRTRYHEALQHLRNVLSIKNAQQEAQTEEEARLYVTQLKNALGFIMGEIGAHRSIRTPVDLLLLFRHVAPDIAAKHPGGYRRTLVQFGPFMAPEPNWIASLVDQLFTVLPELPHPVVRSAYLHHELVRIHPFLDANGRVSRMAKNWLLMYELYPPIFIYTGIDQAAYIEGLQESFLCLERDPNPGRLPAVTRTFFLEEARRIKASTAFLLNRMKNNPELPFGPNDFDASPHRPSTP